MLYDFVKYETVDTLDVVPEAARPLYEAKDGKFTLIAALKPFVTAYMGESTALETVRKDLTKANAESASRRVSAKAVADFLKASGVETVNEENPLETMNTFVTDLIAKGKGGKDLQVNMEKIKQDSERRIGEVNQAADAKVGKMKNVVFKYLGENAAVAAISAAKGNVELLKDHVLKNVKVIEEGDDYVVRIVDDKGDVRSNGAGGWLDVGGLVAEMKTKPTFQVLFESDAKGGSGVKPGSGGNPAPRNLQPGEKSSTQKIADGLKAQK